MDDASARPAGFDPEALAAASDPIKAAIASGDLAGAVTLVWRQGETLRFDCFGKRDIATGAPMERDTLFRIASMTKPVTSVAVLRLMEEGKLALEDPITKWAPEFANMRVLKNAEGPVDDTVPAERVITIEDLLTHRSGLSYGFTSVGPVAHAYQAALGDVLTIDTEPDEWMRQLAGLPLLYQPGERFQYSHATDVLGFIVGRIVGKPFRDHLIETIFGPLGMDDTDFWIPPEKRDRAAVVYRNEVGGLEPMVFPPRTTPPSFTGGGGGLISTASDYLKFAQAMLDGEARSGVRLLKAETLAMMRQNRLTPAQRQIPFLGMPMWMSLGFGLGVSTVEDPVAHQWMGAGSKGSFGWPGAFGTWWQADPEKGLIMIYLIQDSMPLGPEAVANLGQRMGARLALPMWQKAVYAAVD